MNTILEHILSKSRKHHKRIKVRNASLILPLIFFLFIVFMPVADANQLEKIGFSALPGNRVQINLDFADQAPTPLSFSTSNPARIVFDFPGITMNLNQKSQPVGIGVVQSTGAVQTPDRTRVVLNLVRIAPFEIETVGKQLFISIKDIAPSSTMATESPSLTSPASLQPLSTTTPSSQPVAVKEISSAILKGPHIQDINFHRTPEGTGQIVITLSDPAMVVDARQESGNVILDFLNASLPEKLDRRLDVTDFATPVTIIDTSAEKDQVRMTIKAQGDYEYHSQQTENIYTVEVNKKVEIKEETLEIQERKYGGQLVSFNFQNIEVRAALALLFDLPGVNLNMVVTDEVKGNITLRLKNIPWDQALDIILESRGLGKRQIGNVMIIDLKQHIDERKQKELEAQKAIKELEPVFTEFFQINYAQAKDIEELLKQSGKHSFLSSRGNVSKDQRTNTLIIQDTAAKLTEIRDLIKSLDTPVRQVLIESRIVDATDDFNKQLGVKFGYSANEDLGHGNGIVVGGKMPGDTKFSGGTAFTQSNTGLGTGENFIVNLPISASGAIGLAVGKIGSYLLQLELAAAEKKGITRTISSPRVITGNQQEAVISQGDKVPYKTISSQQGQQTQFERAALELKVKPQITPDDRIILELDVTANAINGQTPDGQLIIGERRVMTKVLVDNGETIVLGGVYKQIDSTDLTRIPFFADLPLVGNLFESKINKNNNTELLVFVTPKIIKERI